MNLKTPVPKKVYHLQAGLELLKLLHDRQMVEKFLITDEESRLKDSCPRKRVFMQMLTEHIMQILSLKIRKDFILCKNIL